MLECGKQLLNYVAEMEDYAKEMESDMLTKCRKLLPNLTFQRITKTELNDMLENNSATELKDNLLKNIPQDLGEKRRKYLGSAFAHLMLLGYVVEEKQPIENQ